MNSQDEPTDTSKVQHPADDIPVSGGAQASSNTSQQAPSGQAITEIPLPPGAEDSDLIEKEWVERAKQIVEHTREDPYEQQRALSEMKADYLKKRYGKDIKLHNE